MIEKYVLAHKALYIIWDIRYAKKETSLKSVHVLKTFYLK
jgi:hypothetical protein